MTHALLLSSGARRLLGLQDGIIAREQLHELGLDDNDVEVLLRSPDLHRAARGVYRTFTGEPAWRQRVWIATLRFAPAVAAGRTCLALAGLAPPPPTIEVAVDACRRVGGESGVLVRRSRAFAQHALMDAHPPRMRLEPAVLDVLGSLDETNQVALLGDVLRSRRTTVERLRDELDSRARFRGRDLVAALLDEAGGGVQSVLEHRYLRDVERAHGLPRADRQVRADIPGHAIYRDAVYLGGRLVVELDGRHGHETSRDRWADAGRDLHILAAGGCTLRITYGQVLEPCRTAALVARVLTELGWVGRPSPCGARCAVSAAAELVVTRARADQGRGRGRHRA